LLELAEAPSRFDAPAVLLVVGSILGLLVIVGVMVIAIRILRRPTYRYQGDPTPQDRRSFRETMVTWLMGR
jgi:hypothetical protein